jgi:hypothetical protein
MSRTTNKPDAVFWQPHLQPKSISAGNKKRKRNNDKDRLETLINKVQRKRTNKGYRVDDRSIKSLADYLQIDVFVESIIRRIQRSVDLYKELSNREGVTIPEDVVKKLKILRKALIEIQLLENENEGRYI